MMRLEGSCHCGAVSFTVRSRTPQPYMLCYCSICRKTGGSGAAINLMGDASTLEIEGEDNLSVYRARDPLAADGRSPAKRHFCKTCGSALFVSDPRWPDLVHPHASAIDTPLPEPAERAHIMLESKASWIHVPEGPGEKHFSDYPDQSIEDWHKTRGLYL